MGLIILNDSKERNEMILGLRVTVCGSGDGVVIKLHHEFRSMVIPMVCEAEWSGDMVWTGEENWILFFVFVYLFIYFRYDIVSWYCVWMFAFII